MHHRFETLSTKSCTDAIFGEKDFQQLRVLRAMNRQLWLGINIHGGEVIREADGLQ